MVPLRDLENNLLKNTKGGNFGTVGFVAIFMGKQSKGRHVPKFVVPHLKVRKVFLKAFGFAEMGTLSVALIFGLNIQKESKL